MRHVVARRGVGCAIDHTDEARNVGPVERPVRAVITQGTAFVVEIVGQAQRRIRRPAPPG